MPRDFNKLSKVFSNDPETSGILLVKEISKLHEKDQELEYKIENIQLIKGDTGEKGEQGIQGEPGVDGIDGINGKDGRNGIDGIDGKNGKDGKDGSPDTPEQIVEKIHLSKDKIQTSAIEGIPTISEIVSEIKKNKLIELRDIKGARLDNANGGFNMNDQRWHGGGSGGGLTMQQSAMMSSYAI